jgi:hypothetical protein
MRKKRISKNDLLIITQFRLWLQMMHPRLLEKFDALRIQSKVALIEEYGHHKDRAIFNWSGTRY